MPHISVKLYPGKSEEMKENLAKAVSLSNFGGTRQWITR